MEQKRTAEAAPNTAAKLQKKSHLLNFQVGKLPCSTINLALVIATDPDPMDWNELDSFSNKPPQRERKPRKKPYNKPALVKRFEAVTGNTYRDDTANGLTRLIIDCIRHGGGQAERINTTGIPIDTRQEVTDILGHRHMIGSLTWRKGGGAR